MEHAIWYEDIHARCYESRTNRMLEHHYQQKQELEVKHVYGIVHRSLYYNFPNFLTKEEIVIQGKEVDYDKVMGHR